MSRAGSSRGVQASLLPSNSNSNSVAAAVCVPSRLVQVYRRTLERTKSAAEKIKGHKLTQAALAATTDQLAALQSTAAKAGEVVARHIDAAEAAKDTRKAAAAAAAADNTAAAAAAAAAGGDGRQVHPTESFEDEGEGAEATAAAAAGDIVDAQLFAPGRLLYVKPVDEQETEEQQRFELVDGHGGEWMHQEGCRRGGAQDQGLMGKCVGCSAPHCPRVVSPCRC